MWRAQETSGQYPGGHDEQDHVYVCICKRVYMHLINSVYTYIQTHQDKKERIEELKKLLSVEPEESANTTSITIRVPSG